MTVATVVATPVVVSSAEVQVASAATVIAAAKRRRPVEAVATSVVDFCIVATARSGQEDAVTIRACDGVTVNAVLGGQSPSAVVAEFILFGFGRHSPTASPFYVGYIILGVEDGFIVNSAIIAISAILGLCVVTAIAPFVGAPVIVTFFLGFAPGVIIAIALRL